MDEKIRASQFRFLIVSFIMGSTLLITMIDGIAGQSSWIVIILGFIVSVPFWLIYAHLSKRFPGKSLIQMNDIIFGRVIGKAVSMIYILYFFLLLTFNINDVSGFYTAYVMPETPQMVFIVVFVLVCAFAVQRGISAVAKISLLTAVYTIAAVLITTLMLIDKMDFSNFLPMLSEPAIKYVQSTHIAVVIPFLEVVSLLMVTPMIKDNKKLSRVWLSGGAIAALLILTIVVRDTAVLGAAAEILSDNSYEAIRLIRIGEFFTRIELLVGLNYTASLFVKNSVLYYVVVTAISQLLRIERSSPLILPIGSIAIVFAAVKVESAVIHTVWGAKYAPFFSLPCTVILPLLTVIIAALRKLKTAPPEAQPGQASLPKQRPRRQAKICPSPDGQN
jgi:spore germination protein KB